MVFEVYQYLVSGGFGWFEGNDNVKKIYAALIAPEIPSESLYSSDNPALKNTPYQLFVSDFEQLKYYEGFVVFEPHFYAGNLRAFCFEGHKVRQ